jgi:polar amino acid transport system permease protein
MVMLDALAIDFEWGQVREYLWNPIIREGAWRTLQVSILAQIIGILLGVILALMQGARNPVPRVFSGFYVWIFRGTPALLQLFILYFGIPQLFDNQTLTNELTAFRAAVIAFGLNEAAYMSEIVRSGILSVDRGQMDAAKSVGMTNLQGMRRVVLPQAIRVMIPPTGNEFIAMLKNSAIASTIGLVELTLAARQIYAVNFDIMELLVVAAIWYLAFTTIFVIIQAEVERFITIDERDRKQTLLSRVIGIYHRVPLTAGWFR